MNILEIIEKKRDKKELSKEEIEYFIEGYTNNKIADYQASALIMAIYLNGMTKQETTNLTLAMANSGEKLDLSTLNIIATCSIFRCTCSKNVRKRTRIYRRNSR